MIFWNKYQSLLITLFNTYSSLPFSPRAESEVWPRTCFPKVSPCQCTVVLYHAPSCTLFSIAEKFKAVKQFHPKDGQALAPEPLLRLETALEALLTNKKEKKSQEKSLYTSIFKERLILLQIPQVNLWPVKCNGGIPNKRHQAWHVPWYLHSNGESSFMGRTPKMIYYLNQHGPTNSPQADFSPSLSL